MLTAFAASTPRMPAATPAFRAGLAADRSVAPDLRRSAAACSGWDVAGLTQLASGLTP